MWRFLLRIFVITSIVYASDNSYAQTSIAGNSVPGKPNIIFILTDDHRWDAIGFAGNKFATTPEMDKLAAAGTYFKKALVTTPICAASRASIISGLYERTHKYTFRTAAIRSEYMEDAYPNLLRKAGYYTGFFGKFGVKYDNIKSLFDEADDYDRNVKYTDKRSYFYKTINKDTVHLTRYTGQQGLDFIENAPAGKPFCLQLSFSAPHAHDNAPDQYFWQAQTDKLYQNVSMPAADLGDIKYFNALPAKVKTGFSRLRWTWRFDTPEKYQRSVKGYYRMIAEIDSEIGKIRSLLKQKGLDQNTIIIVMGDNGYFLGERQIADKWLMYDQSVRVPLIVFDPRADKHFVSEEQALNIDVPATIVDAAGINIPSGWHGKSLLPLVAGKTKNLNRDTVLIEHLWEFDEIPPSEGLRTAKWKYFRYVNDKSIEELYDLENDPKEINNLAGDPIHVNQLNSFRKKLDELIVRYRDPYSNVPTELVSDFDVKNPPSLEDNHLSLSWTIPKEAESQLGYQVLVSSSKENINNNVGDIWNSQQVRVDSSKTVYKGHPLKEGRTYYWKVRIWDKDNRLTDYSGVQSFRRTKQN